MSSTKEPGDRIETRCSRCDDITGHFVVALVAGKIIKVECLACKSVHKYYAPKPEKIIKSESTRKTRNTTGYVKASENLGSQKTANARSKSVKIAMATEQAWQAALLKPSASEEQPYTMSMSLAVGDIIKHPSFGLGAVSAIISSDKAEILFREGTRLLIYAYNKA